MPNLRVLIADDQLHVRITLQHRIKKCLSDYCEIEFSMAQSATEAVDLVSSSKSNGQLYDFISLDINFAPTDTDAPDGHWAASQIREIVPESVIVIVSSYPNHENLKKVEVNTAVTRLFSRDEFTDKELCRILLFALKRKLHREQDLLAPEKIIFTRSSKMQNYLDQLDQVDPESNIMIYGETGTGKELSARRLHANAAFDFKQKNRPFVAVNCGAIPEELVESELFGHVKGSFTGASSDKEGLLSQANRGDLFFDELQNASPRFQKTVMRAIQEKNFRPVGSNRVHDFNCRIISALNINPTEAKESGQLMKDFMARLNTEYLSIPSLRDRNEDFELLIELVLNQNKESNKRFSKESIEFLKTLPWPENIRSYLATVKAAINHSKTPIIGLETLKRLSCLDEKKVNLEERTFFDPSKDIIKSLIEVSLSEQTSLQNLIDRIEREYIAASIRMHGCRNMGELQKWSWWFRLDYSFRCV